MNLIIIDLISEINDSKISFIKKTIENQFVLHDEFVESKNKYSKNLQMFKTKLFLNVAFSILIFFLAKISIYFLITIIVNLTIYYFLLTKTYKKSKQVKIELSYKQNRYLSSSVIFDTGNSSTWKDILKLIQIKDKTPFQINNIIFNQGILVIDNKYFLFDKIIIVKNPNLKIFFGNECLKHISYESELLSEQSSNEYRFRYLELKRWWHERKNGGPDRRFSHNPETRYYRVNFPDFGTLLIVKSA